MSRPAQVDKMRILMLHGYTQSGPSFLAKTRALEKPLQKAFPGIELVYPTGPIKLSPAQIPGFDVDGSSSADAWGWWVRQGDSEPFTYAGIEQGLECVARVLQTQGPFTGVIGFSQGGALAGMVASLLEKDRRQAFESRVARGGMAFPEFFVTSTGFLEENIHPPLEFAVSYSGFGATTNPLYMGFYEPKIRTPMLHFLGSVDTVVEEARSLRLVDACVDGRGGEGTASRVIYHPGGHFLPSSQKQYVAALVSFIRLVTEKKGEEAAKEDGVEDMDMPF